MAPRRYISLAEFSEQFGISDRTARRWVASGKIRAVRLSERVIRIDSEEVERFLAKASGDIGPDPAP